MSRIDLAVDDRIGSHSGVWLGGCGARQEGARSESGHQRMKHDPHPGPLGSIMRQPSPWGHVDLTAADNEVRGDEA